MAQQYFKILTIFIEIQMMMLNSRRPLGGGELPLSFYLYPCALYAHLDARLY